MLSAELLQEEEEVTRKVKEEEHPSPCSSTDAGGECWCCRQGTEQGTAGQGQPKAETACPTQSPAPF